MAIKTKLTAEDQCRKNFIKAMHTMMVDNEVMVPAQFVEMIGMARATYHNITSLKQYPTIEQIITLCNRGNFNANWILLNKGEMRMEEQITMTDIARALKLGRHKV